MVRVGVVAAILNVTILLFSAFFERVIEKMLRLFTISRLKATGRAPVVHDSYVWLLNIPRSVLHLYKYPGKSSPTLQSH